MKEVKIIFNNDTRDYTRIFGDRFKQLSKAMQENINIAIHHGEGLPIGKEIRKDKLSVLIWGSHKTDDMIYSESNTAFGKQFYSDALFVPSEGTIQFGDGEVVLAEYDEENKVLNFLYDMWEYESLGEIELFNIIMDKFVEHLFGSIDGYCEKLEEAIRIEREASIQKAVSHLMSTIESDKRNLENKLREAKQRMEEYMAKVKQYSLNAISFEKQLEGLGSGMEGIKAKLISEIKAMESNKKIEEVFFNENGDLVLDTVELFAKARTKKGVKRFRMGRFRIEVRLQNGQTLFFNRDIQNIRHSVWGACHHPHVSETGSGCLGNASTLIAECIMNREWAMLADVLVNYLESINEDDGAGKCYTNWDEVDEEGNTLERQKYTGEFVSDERNRELQVEMVRRVKEGRYVAGIQYMEVK